MGDSRIEAADRLRRALADEFDTEAWFEWNRIRDEELERDSVPAESEAERVYNLEADR
jgi:hypothetical protein